MQQSLIELLGASHRAVFYLKSHFIRGNFLKFLQMSLFRKKVCYRFLFWQQPTIFLRLGLAAKFFKLFQKSFRNQAHRVKGIKEGASMLKKSVDIG